jgi:tetratricopeptide (TPR) repeat protein
MNRRERRAAAKASKTRPRSNERKTPAALYEAGLRHLQAGRDLDAQLCCQQALAIDAHHADSLYLMGLLCLRARQYDHAMEWLARAFSSAPKAEYLSALGITLKMVGRLEDAANVFNKALQLKPDSGELWRHLGGSLAALNRPADALLSYSRALGLDTCDVEASFQAGALLHQMDRFEEAITHFNRCDALRPDHAITLHMRARAWRGLKRYRECLADNRRAHELDPTDPVFCNNIADALTWLGDSEEALEWFDKALRLKPDLVEALSNKGFALAQLHRFDEAIEIYQRRVLVLDPDNAKGTWALAHLHLQMGDFEAGWAEREARWRVPDFSPEYPRFAQPKWLGKEDIKGKTVLICIDEGLGDTLQFARYVPLVVARGANVVLVVQDALRPLLSGLAGVSQCLPFGTTHLPPFDLHCPIMSLPLAFGTTLETIPPDPYLPPLPPDRVKAWGDRLGVHDRLRVGLVWSGNPKQRNDHNRSMPLAMLSPLLDLDATFVSLQKDVRAEDKLLLASRTDIIDLTADLADFVETAALIQNLDLVITVCTSVAHLAGTLGRETWVMLPYLGDWRWLLDRDDSPWYPSVRLFRQGERRDYASVVARVRAELVARIPAFRPSA